MTSRRTVLKAGAWLAAAGALPRIGAAAPAPTLLIMGGTGFIGPHLTREALRRGWQVTHFNRGRKSADVPVGVETLTGDRNGQLDALRGRKWDAMIDDTGYVPKYVRASAELLAPSVGFCLYVSSISAYASFAKPNTETSPTGTLADPELTQVTETTYGPMKALCERYTSEAFSGRCAIVRPGYIVGPGDNTDRFTYWVVRASKGGEMLAPGTPRDPIQVIDVRDLAAWTMSLVDARTTGVYNADSPPGALTMGDLVTESLHASPRTGTTATWVPVSFLEKFWKRDELDFPPWSPPEGDTAADSLTSTSAAEARGLRCRPLAQTVRDTLEWFRSLPAERQAKLKVLIEPARETEVLRAWRAARAAG